MNSVKTALLLGLLSGLMLAVGEMLGGSNGLMIGLLLAVGTNFFSYFFSERLTLMTYSAEPVTPEDHPDVYARVYPWSKPDATNGAADAEALADSDSVA